jgi:hypothetical protein
MHIFLYTHIYMYIYIFKYVYKYIKLSLIFKAKLPDEKRKITTTDIKQKEMMEMKQSKKSFR